jgi:hypothetical protein
MASLLMMSLGWTTAAAAQTRTPPVERLKPATGTEAVRPCPEYGPGFVRAPGSTICVKLNGQVRGETMLRRRQSGLEPATASRVTAGLRLEARSQSDYGPVRAVVDTRQRRAPGDPLR